MFNCKCTTKCKWWRMSYPIKTLMLMFADADADNVNVNVDVKVMTVRCHMLAFTCHMLVVPCKLLIRACLRFMVHVKKWMLMLMYMCKVIRHSERHVGHALHKPHALHVRCTIELLISSTGFYVQPKRVSSASGAMRFPTSVVCATQSRQTS